jgi:hypothetical protein
MIQYLGTSIANFKAVKVAPGPNVALLASKVISIGLGSYAVTHTGWDATAITTAWNSALNALLNEITAVANEDGSITFTQNNSGKDFELTITIDGGELQVSTYQTITFSPLPSGGTFTLSDGNLTTGNITWSGTPSTLVTNMQNAINALAGYTAGDVVVSSLTSSTYQLSFASGRFANLAVGLWSIDYTSLTGGTAGATITTTQQGNSGTSAVVEFSFPVTGDLTGKEVQKITLSGTNVHGATWTLSLDAGSTFTDPIPAEATAKQVAIAVEETFDLTPEDIVVFGPAGGPFLIYWTDDSDHDTIQVDEQQASSSGGNLIAFNRDDSLDNEGWYASSGPTWSSTGVMAAVSNSSTKGFMRFHMDTLPAGSTLASALMSLVTTGSNTPTVDLTVQVTAYNGGHNASWPANAGQAATALAAAGAEVATFVLPAFAGAEEQTVSFDITNVLQQAIDQASYVAGDHILLFFTIPAAGTDGFNTDNGSYGNWSLLVDYGVATATDLSAAVTTIADGGTLSQTITGGTFDLKIVGPSTVNVHNIAYNASAATVVSAVNAAAGATIVSGTGGALPATAVALTFINTFEKAPITLSVTSAFTGVFAGAITSQVIRTNTAPVEALNVWDMTICPGQGTLGVDPSLTGVHNFFVISIVEPTDQLSDVTVLDTQTSVASSQKKIYVRLYDVNAMRIQRAINEAYAADVCRVTRVTHSHEWRRIINPTVVSAGFDSAQPFYCWYYRDVFRITFINRFAAANTITDISVTSAPVSSVDSTPTGPDAWMTTSQELPVTSLPYDLSNEAGRTYQGFIAMAAEDTPLHIFSASRCTENVSNLLSFRFKLAAQYGNSAQDAITAPTDYSGITTQLVGYQIRFRWVRLTKNNTAETAIESDGAGGDTIAQSTAIPWDATNEQIAAAIESLDTAFVGNVQVTGSLVNSWKPEDYTDLDDGEEDYNDLLVTLTNKLAYLPLNEQWYELRMSVVAPSYLMADTSYSRQITNLSELFSVPLPPFKNYRVRYTMAGDASYVIGYNGTTSALTQNASITSIETVFNQLLGSYTSNAVPSTYTKSAKVYGVPFTDGSWDVEFTGNGLQQTGFPSGLIVGSSALGLVSTTTTGVSPVGEVETLVITGTPRAGTYTLTATPGTTGSLAYNANAATIQTALRALTGYTSVTVTGTWPSFTITFPSSLGNVTQLTASTTLHNAAGTIAFSQQGGPDSQLAVSDVIPGRGPSYYDVAENYSPENVPGSGATLVYDNATTPVYYGLDQTSVFKVASLTDSTLRHKRNRKVFCDDQKVRFLTTGTAPSGLTDGNEYYIVNASDDYQFQLSATLGGSAIAISSVGTGVHSLQVESVEVQVFNRYSGGTIGLPIRRSNNMLEYLPLYLKIPGMDVTFGFTADEGNGVSMFKGDTGDLESHIIVNQTGQASGSLPAVFLLFNNAASTLEMFEGQVAIAFYTGESSLLASVTEHAGELTMCDTTVDTLAAGGRDVASQSLRNCTINEVINI